MSTSKSKLHTAVQNEDLSVVVKLLKGKKGRKDINVRDSSGHCPLHTACFDGNVELVKELLRRNADPDLSDKNDWTPLHAAASGLALGHLKCCEVLLAYGANPFNTTQDGSSALHYAVRMDVPDEATELSQKVIRSLSSPPESVTDVKVREKMRHRIVNKQNKHGESPLFHACSRGIERSAEFLAKELGADVNLANNLDQTALHAAAYRGNSSIVAMLLKLNADADRESDMGTPLEIAARYEHWAVATVLKSHFTPRMLENLARQHSLTEEDRKASAESVGKSGKDEEESSESVETTGFGFIIGGGGGDDEESSDYSADGDDVAFAFTQGGKRDVSGADSDLSEDEADGVYSPRYPFRTWRYTCPSCGTSHTSLAMNFHMPSPKDWNSSNRIDEESRLSMDLCKIKAVGAPHTKYFVRGLLRIAIKSPSAKPPLSLSSRTSPGPACLVDRGMSSFVWGVWVRVSPDQFRTIVDSWRQRGRENARPYRGVLAVSLPGYELDTYNLKVRVRTQRVGLRPIVEVRDDEAHPLVAQQQNGVSTAELLAMVPDVEDYFAA